MAEQTHIHKTTFQLQKSVDPGRGDGVQFVYSHESGVVFIQVDLRASGWVTIAEMTPTEMRNWVSALDKWAVFIDKV
jgi:hypothetical protein